MSCCPEPDNHIRDKINVVVSLSNYVAKRDSEHAVGVDKYDFSAKKVAFVALLL